MSAPWVTVSEKDGGFSCSRCGGSYLPAYDRYPREVIMCNWAAFLKGHSDCQPDQRERDRECSAKGGPLGNVNVKAAMEVKIMDPCCGSGMFLIEALHMLVPMRVSQEGLPEWVVAELVIRDNLFGLDIDPRSIQAATFALTVEAWKYGAGGMIHKRKPGERTLEEWRETVCKLAERTD